MGSPATLYSSVLTWLVALGVCRHTTAARSLAFLVTALLIGQSLRPAVLLRTWVSSTPVPARQGFKRLARAFDRPGLASAHLTPCLVRAALALLPRQNVTHLALDGVRCGAWEVLVIGVVWDKRVLPVGWAVLPYPWPKGRLTPTVCALIRQVAASWPGDQPVHLVADRGFPSRDVFRTLTAVSWGFTVRLGARSLVTINGEACWAKEVLAHAKPGQWQAYLRATYGSAAPLVAGHLMVGKDVTVLPGHQANPGSIAHRVHRQRQRHAHLGRKHQRARGTSGAAVATDGWVMLFTTHATARAAASSYRMRWSIESSFRDAQGGGDGRAGWELEETLKRVTVASRVERVVGLWAVGTLLQTWIGAGTIGAAIPTEIASEVESWTTTGRLSIWMRGRLALLDRRGRLEVWIGQRLAEGMARVELAPPVPSSAPVLLPTSAHRRATVPPDADALAA